MSKKQRVSPLPDGDTQSIFSYPPIMLHLIPFLPLISVLSLLRACPRIREYVKGHTVAMQRYAAFLSSLDYSSEVVEHLLSQHPEDFAFTGSSVLKVLLGADWITNDVDVASYDDTLDQPHGRHPNVSHRLYLDRLLQPKFYPRFRDLPYENQCFDHVEDGGKNRVEVPIWELTESVYPGCDGVIFRVYNYRVKDSSHPFQVIQLRCNMEAYINVFDLNVCANYLTSRRLVIKNPVGILKQTITYNMLDDRSAKEKKTMGRLKKYEARGFNINIINTRTKNNTISF